MMEDKILIALGAVLVIVLVDTLFGIILAIKAGTFDIRKLPQFMVTNLVPYGGGLAVLALGSLFAGEYSGQILALFYATAAATAVKFIAEIKDKAVQIFGELEMETTLEGSDLYEFLTIKIKEAIIEALQDKTTA